MKRRVTKWLVLLALLATTALVACDGCEDPRDVPEPEVVPEQRSPAPGNR